VLHVSRTQLSHYISPHSGNTALNMRDFCHAHKGSGADAAVDALTHESNMLLEVSLDPPEIVVEEIIQADGSTRKETKKTAKRLLFHELVQRNLSLFEKLHDHQKLLMESDGIDLRRIDREKLEGWDFLEIVSGESSLKPRFESLKGSGRAWIDFTREIHTINFLGRSFGQLIQPAEDASTLCEGWKQVPKGNEFLTTCVSTLDEICMRHGNSQARHFELVNGINWHKPQLLFETCDCPSGVSVCDRVQVLLPPLSTQSRRPEPFLEGRGAVIFGRSKTFAWRYPNQGTPTRGFDDQLVTSYALSNGLSKLMGNLSPSDSGMGSSISTLSAHSLVPIDPAAEFSSSHSQQPSVVLSPRLRLPTYTAREASSHVHGVAVDHQDQGSQGKSASDREKIALGDGSSNGHAEKQSSTQPLAQPMKMGQDRPRRAWSTRKLQAFAASVGGFRTSRNPGVALSNSPPPDSSDSPNSRSQI
jgi:hypothetical protein